MRALSLISAAALLALGACSTSGSTVSPAQAATDIGVVIQQATNLQKQFGASLTAQQNAIITNALTLAQNAATALGGQTWGASTLASAKQAADDLVALANDPAVAALIPAQDKTAFIAVQTALNVGVPIIEADVAMLAPPAAAASAN